MRAKTPATLCFLCSMLDCDTVAGDGLSNRPSVGIPCSLFFGVTSGIHTIARSASSLSPMSGSIRAVVAHLRPKPMLVVTPII